MPDSFKIFDEYAIKTNAEIKKLLDEQHPYYLYDMMRYFLGYLDKNFNPVELKIGKKFRSGLCMLVADMYCSSDVAIELAASIEVFHNFTLIHDDIVDNDPLRRGRETVWKLWGVNQAINTGDAQFLLSNIELRRAESKLGSRGKFAADYLQKVYLEIVEGQFLDIYLTDINLENKDVNESSYMEMIRKKTSIIIGGAAKVAGIATGQSEKEIENLNKFGVNLGIAYQLCDDLISIWGDPEMTGKIAANDLREKKKTLPVIHLYNKLSDDKKDKLSKIYNQNVELAETEISWIIGELNQINAYEYVWAEVEKYKKQIGDAVESLSISVEDKNKLKEIANDLLPNVKELCKC